MSKKNKEIYEFGPFRLDVGEHVFERADGVENGSLPEKAFQTLVLLVRNRGELVTKNELIEAIWPDTIVEDNNLDKCIHNIRNALHDSAGEQKYVETVRKHGYRFIADVHRLNDGPDPSGDVVSTDAAPALEERDIRLDAPNSGQPPLDLASGVTPEKSGPKEFRWLNNTAAAISLSVITVGLIAAVLYLLWPIPAPAGDRTSIAVLPVRPMGGTVRNEVHEIGIADSLINRLGSINGIAVRHLNSTLKYSGPDQDPVAAGKEQLADFVLASNYQLSDGKIRITAQLINTATGIVDETFQTEMDSERVFAVQDAIAAEIGNRLQQRFGTNSTVDVAKRGTRNEDAYRNYLTGVNLRNRRGGTASRQAVKYFEQAVKLDPDFARAWAQLAGSFRDFSSDPHEANAKAMAAINRALELDPNLPEAYVERAATKLYYEWDFKGAEHDALRAVELEGGTGVSCRSYAYILSLTGRFDESIAQMKRAIDADPNSVTLQRDLGTVLYNARRFNEAIVQLERVVEIDPSFRTAYFWLWQSYELTGQHQKAFEVFLKGNQRGMNEAELRKVFEKGGWKAVLRMRLADWTASERTGEGDINYYHMAMIAAQLGERDMAFSFLTKLFEARGHQMSRVNIEPAFDPLRGDPRFAELVHRLGL